MPTYKPPEMITIRFTGWISMVAHACHPKNFCFWHSFQKENKKNFQKLKQFYFRLENTFISQMVYK